MGDGVDSMLLVDLEDEELEESNRRRGGEPAEEKDELRPVYCDCRRRLGRSIDFLRSESRLGSRRRIVNDGQSSLFRMETIRSRGRFSSMV